MDNETLNQIIRGIIKFRKCPCCDNEGIELQNYDMCGEPCAVEADGASRFLCENCEGLGFVYVEN